MSYKSDTMQKIISLAKRRGFVFPGSEIYGGLANSFDFGPLGAQLKKNIKNLWWQRFVESRDDIVGIDAALMMNPKVWEASGHVAGFSDPLVECKKCKKRFRADHLYESHLEKGTSEVAKYIQESIENGVSENKALDKLVKDLTCLECGGELSKPKNFNLMFKTHIGPVEVAGSEVYLRPETAQAMFVNYKNILDSTRMSLPFGIAQIGKAFRNEITPGNFIFRVLEFEQMEIEYFVNEQDWKRIFDDWQVKMREWLSYIGIKRENYTIREHDIDELSHYSKRTVDFEYCFPFGKKELYGLAYRTNFDLSAHEKYSGEKLKYRDSHSGDIFIPHVIEPTFGVERTVLALLCDAYCEIEGGRGEGAKSETEVVLRLDKKIAPIKAAVFPLMKKKHLMRKAREVVHQLRHDFLNQYGFVVAYDDSGSIGKRYRRHDEIGTPYCITVDFDTLNDNAVTLRDRDSMSQERISVSELCKYIKDQFL